MNRTLCTLLIAALGAVVSVAASLPAFADSKDDTLEPDKGVAPHQTVQARYDVAMSRAEARLRDDLAQCDRMQAADRAQCVRDAENVHDGAVARANDLLSLPR
ncbi:MAG TPA: hypothetical protein VF457_06780 [Burkholderiaceae bacterium]